jgi:hypothetical protein
MVMERWWSVEAGKKEILEDISQCYSVQYKRHKDWPGIETGISQ